MCARYGSYKRRPERADDTGGGHSKLSRIEGLQDRRQGTGTSVDAGAQEAVRLELLGGALCHDGSLVHDRHLVGETIGLLQVLGGEQDREASFRAKCEISRHISARASGSRPVVGSSRKSTSGWCTRPMATSSLR